MPVQACERRKSKGDPPGERTTYCSRVSDTANLGDVLWACVEEGFHVGSRDGNFLGYVDRQPDGSYRAFDARSHLIGDHAHLADATRAVARMEMPAVAGDLEDSAEGVR